MTKAIQENGDSLWVSGSGETEVIGDCWESSFDRGMELEDRL